MSDSELFKHCRYREYRDVHLVCTITDTDISTKYSTNLTKAGICNKCQIPNIIQQVNCINLIISKEHDQRQCLGLDRLESIMERHWQVHCAIVAFDNREDYKSKCSSNCFGYQAVRRSPISQSTEGKN